MAKVSFVTNSQSTIGKKQTAALKLHSKNIQQYDQQQPKRSAVFLDKVGNQEIIDWTLKLKTRM